MTRARYAPSPSRDHPDRIAAELNGTEYKEARVDTETEAEACRTVCKALRLAGVLYFKIPNESRVGRSCVAAGLVRGAPDYVIACRGGKTVWLEMKRPGGSLGKTQVEVRDKLERRGHVHIVGKGSRDALRKLQEAGVL